LYFSQQLLKRSSLNILIMIVFSDISSVQFNVVKNIKTDKIQQKTHFISSYACKSQKNFATLSA